MKLDLKRERAGATLSVHTGRQAAPRLPGQYAPHALPEVAPMPESNDIQMSEQFADLCFLALDHGVDSVRTGGGPLTPFVAFEQDGKRELRRFAAERLEEGQQRAREAITAFPSSV